VGRCTEKGHKRRSSAISERRKESSGPPRVIRVMSHLQRSLDPKPKDHASSSYHKASREQKSVNVHSISAFGDDQGAASQSAGAYIPDIPLRHSNRRLSVVELITSPPFKTHRKPRFEDGNCRPICPDSIATPRPMR
jgi:hypothetical protein